jgi:UDP-MurNAc hydroxylase
MRFVILSHAGLAVEHKGVRLVCDPWLIGSCYWRSWWNFPEPDPALVQNLAPQYIYLTHLHWDHFHGPSLKKLFDPKTTIVVPKVPTQRMVDDLRWLGFHNVIEVPHGGNVRLGDDFNLRSYQFGFGVDSAAVLTGGGFTLFNCNDCKLFGLPLRQILRDHPKIDFIFRSHSSATPVPLCVENHETLLPPDDGSYDSADQFARCAIFTRARFAIPFASNHCFLHPETRRFNATVTTPELASRRYAALAAEAGINTQCTVMPPGSSWCDATGFALKPFDFSQRESYVEGMLQRNAAALAAQCEKEAASIADFASFQCYFQNFFRALPWFIRRWTMPAIVFRVKDSQGVHLWLADPKRESTERDLPLPEGTVVIDVHATVLNDCATAKMFSVWTASKRLKIHLPNAASLAGLNLWFTLLDLYETDTFPLYKNFRLRSLAVRLRRWREPVELANIVLRRIFLRQRFSVSRIYPMDSTQAQPVIRSGT